MYRKRPWKVEVENSVSMVLFESDHVNYLRILRGI